MYYSGLTGGYVYRLQGVPLLLSHRCCRVVSARTRAAAAVVRGRGQWSGGCVNGVGSRYAGRGCRRSSVVVVVRNSAGNRAGSRAGSSGDSDDFELEPEYDSDEYEYDDSDEYEYGDGSVAVSSDMTASTSTSTAAATTTDAAQGDHEEKNNNSNNNNITIVSLVLLIGAATDRFVSRVQYGIVATARFALMCMSDWLHPFKERLRSRGDRMMARFRLSPMGKKLKHIQKQSDEIQKELPDDLWGKLLWLWDRPPVQRIRLTVSMANLSFRLPALVALVVTQGSLLASQVSLPMLAPLLLGTGMMMRSIKSNASFLFPRIGLLVVLLWILWFTNSVIQNTVQYLKKQKAIDDRLASGVITVTEVSTLLVAFVVLLSMIGVNVSALLLPAGIAIAIAAKDLSHNFLAGFFLFVVQPFKLGDRVAVSSSAPSQGPGPMGAPPGWFEGVCEKVDLRYTVVRQGRRKLMIPNSTFLTREFMVLDDMTASEASPSNGNGSSEEQVEFLTNDNRHVWQYIQGPPFHQELAGQPPQNGGVNQNGGSQYPPSPAQVQVQGQQPPPVVVPPQQQQSLHIQQQQPPQQTQNYYVNHNNAIGYGVQNAAVNYGGMHPTIMQHNDVVQPNGEQQQQQQQQYRGNFDS